MSLALFAMSVPLYPIQKPTSEIDKTGASLVPDPVTATVF